ncbi:hypothetical protein [Aetokthonos hydrillicola]|uniref:hypothetical protein n=1 Tax=Aetokthonos hydrillicola TaxID=1550245 RepID=UPI001ABB701E|nr:hypothetical protein [Aetokthonos hydrillicola]
MRNSLMTCLLILGIAPFFVFLIVKNSQALPSGGNPSEPSVFEQVGSCGSKYVNQFNSCAQKKNPNDPNPTPREIEDCRSRVIGDYGNCLSKINFSPDSSELDTCSTARIVADQCWGTYMGCGGLNTPRCAEMYDTCIAASGVGSCQ